MSEQTPVSASEPQRQSFWMRGLFTLLFLFLFGVGQSIMTAAAILQFLWVAFTGVPNAQIGRFGRSLGRWLGEVVLYALYETDDRPFPWAEWPSAV